MKGIFDTRANTIYDDEIASRYHFPSNYREIAEQLVGSWILYREPRRERGRRGYVATARVIAVQSDATRPGSAYALVTDYTPFDRVVPFVRDGRYAEAELRENADPSNVGRAVQGKSIREIGEDDYADIVLEGLGGSLAGGSSLFESGEEIDPEAMALLALPHDEQKRRVEQIVLNKKIRDARFRRVICEAYDGVCAVTGLHIVDAKGCCEAQAAHIWSVAAGGPDIVSNGIALSGTVHWLFDRHLISIADDYRLLVSEKVPGVLRDAFPSRDRPIRIAADPLKRPHPAFLARHRALFVG